jgi:hypothetical protein
MKLEAGNRRLEAGSWNLDAHVLSIQRPAVRRMDVGPKDSRRLG